MHLDSNGLGGDKKIKSLKIGAYTSSFEGGYKRVLIVIILTKDQHPVARHKKFMLTTWAVWNRLCSHLQRADWSFEKQQNYKLTNDSAHQGKHCLLYK